MGAKATFWEGTLECQLVQVLPEIAIELGLLGFIPAGVQFAGGQVAFLA